MVFFCWSCVLTDSLARLISLVSIVCSVLCALSCLVFRPFVLTIERFGAAAAAGIYSLFPENAIVLTIFGFFFSMPCFYYIIATPQYATTGRFAILTYNLTCLYSYVGGSFARADF